MDLEKIMSKNLIIDSTISRQYIGTYSGLTRIYPGIILLFYIQRQPLFGGLNWRQLRLFSQIFTVLKKSGFVFMNVCFRCFYLSFCKMWQNEGFIFKDRTFKKKYFCFRNNQCATFHLIWPLTKFDLTKQFSKGQIFDLICKICLNQRLDP